MGEHAELMAKTWDIAREDMDQLTLASQPEPGRCTYERGFFADLMTPFKGVYQRATTCAPTSRSKSCAHSSRCSTKRPAPAKARWTAGNSTPLTDGASAGAAGQ